MKILISGVIEENAYQKKYSHVIGFKATVVLVKYFSII